MKGAKTNAQERSHVPGRSEPPGRPQSPLSWEEGGGGGKWRRFGEAGALPIKPLNARSPRRRTTASPSPLEARISYTQVGITRFVGGVKVPASPIRRSRWRTHRAARPQIPATEAESERPIIQR
ncbi:unnamed protein product [Pleuronectes platessa]|uniref:Uncharacterized protein n=1 Tax=Pleuronectes platessa TaxID=8262 RepID=A0A9N7Y3A5_PLEPL|nr:unnamed protein product [Pleuronectes platessa]